MAIDPRIALGVQPAADPMRSYGQALSLKSLMTQQQMHEQQMADAQQAREERRTLADLYRGAVGPDGSIDNTKLLTGAAQAGLGHQIPGMRKQIMEADKAGADVANLRGQVDERTWKMKRDQLGEVNKALTSLLMQPSVTHDDVIALAQGLVRNGIITPEMGAETVRGLPGNPEQLREFLRQQSLRGLETAKALELMAPKFEKVDTGGDVRFVDTNPWTNPNPQAVAKTATPGDLMAHQRGLASNAIARDRLEWDKTRPPAGTFVETSGGLVVGDPRTGTYRPATPVGMPGTTQAGADPVATQPTPAAAAERPADFGQPALGKPKAQLDAEVKTVERERAQQNAAAVAADTLAVLDKAITHPGRTISTGGSSLLQVDRIPGTDAADFRAIRKQLEGKAFLQAFESLKGGGQITEVEGRKATEAIARLDTAQSDGEYLQALNELRGIVARGYERATGSPYATPAPVPPDAARPAVRPPTVGQVIDGYLFKGGDPANPSSWVKP